MIKQTLKRLPLIGPLSRRIKSRFGKGAEFRNSDQYWKDRYAIGQTSGPGSYNRLAQQKGEIINAFVKEHHVRDVIEFGSGDGNQLSYFDFETYCGFDISPVALDRCRQVFRADSSKRFEALENYGGEKAALAMSLDVIYHLVEDEVYEAYMNRLFGASNRFVLVYSSNSEQYNSDRDAHVRHRVFTDWVAAKRRNFTLLRHIPNRFPYDGNPAVSSFSDFYFFERVGFPAAEGA